MRMLRSGTRNMTKLREIISENERPIMNVLVTVVMVGLERIEMVRRLPMIPTMAKMSESQPLTMYLWLFRCSILLLVMN